ncbi:MAG: hypothetical protein R3C18_00865 [Planctomycetaceae bacterium]
MRCTLLLLSVSIMLQGVTLGQDRVPAQSEVLVELHQTEGWAATGIDMTMYKDGEVVFRPQKLRKTFRGNIDAEKLKELQALLTKLRACPKLEADYELTLLSDQPNARLRVATEYDFDQYTVYGLSRWKPNTPGRDDATPASQWPPVELFRLHYFLCQLKPQNVTEIAPE